MRTAAVAQSHDASATWSRDTPHVRKALAFIKRRGHVTAEELVSWDHANGRRLFNWNDPNAADEWRRQQARAFLNSFRATFDKMRVRAFIHVREDEQAGIQRDAYYTVEAIAKHPGMREQIIADVGRRMTSLASELKMWDLNHHEQTALFQRLAEAMTPADERKTA